jgi:cytochrome o ubiquinol oxidase subunit 3
VTLLLGLIFLGLEVRDFVAAIAKGAPPSRSGFLSAFFVLVAAHGLHVTAGCVWIAVMMAQVRVFGLARDVKTRILRLGLFWHFLDIVWIGIFSVVYLQGLV